MNILVVVAHPDDEVLGAGASIHRLIREGNKVAVGISPVTKIPDLKEKLDAFIDEITADGTLEDMQREFDLPVKEGSSE